MRVKTARHTISSEGREQSEGLQLVSPALQYERCSSGCAGMQTFLQAALHDTWAWRRDKCQAFAFPNVILDMWWHSVTIPAGWAIPEPRSSNNPPVKRAGEVIESYVIPSLQLALECWNLFIKKSGLRFFSEPALTEI